jgi:glutamine amidotransferase
MLKKVGYDGEISISNNPGHLRRASKLILPGVGHFDYGMQQLRKLNLIPLLRERVLEANVPILGICLGAQLLTKESEEGQEFGLGWIDAKTVRFDKEKLGEKLKIPHMGWCEVCFRVKDPLFLNMPQDARFYFVHTYHIVCANGADEAITAKYGYPFTAGIKKENITGVQFHPEKSHKFGMQLFRNFIKKK